MTVKKAKSVEWYTPAWLFDELGLVFDLDPASPHDATTAVPASTKYTKLDNGLISPWFGRVWLNPPFGRETGEWVEKMINHNNGIVLVFSRTDTKWFHSALKSASAILFLSGRVEFIPGHENNHKKSRCGAATVLISFGDECAKALQRVAGRGAFFKLPV